MEYSKPPKSIAEQIEILKSRGLQFPNEIKAQHYLSNISYYRLRAYTYPFQDNSDTNHPFVTKVTFDNIIELYVFDRHLRLLIFDAIEKIEIALRTQIIYNYAMSHGSFWHHNSTLFHKEGHYHDHFASLKKEVDRSKETFIDHYKSTYTIPEDPPCWMALEVSSIGLLSKIFQNLKKSPEKKEIVKSFGLTEHLILENWIFCFCNLRNICAHHGRVWNRRFAPVKIPYNTLYPFLDKNSIYPNKLYAVLCCIEYILKIISPHSLLKDRLKDLMSRCPLNQGKEMGFPDNWQEDSFWK